MEAPRGPGEYEFDASQNKVFAELANKMRFVGTVAFVLGLLTIVGVVIRNQWLRTDVAMIGFGLLNLIIGVLTRKAALAFREVATTQGADIRHLLEALVSLLSLYRIQYVILLAAILLVLLALVLELMRGGGGAAVAGIF